MHLPILRQGKLYESLDKVEIASVRTGAPVATVSQANAGLLRRDLRRLDAAREALRAVPAAELLEICARAGENPLWMPAVALKIPVVLKPGREEPWTPFRIIQAFIAAGAPAEAFSFYPTDHEGSAAILELCGRALIFGDESTVARYAGNPAVQVHGP